MKAPRQESEIVGQMCQDFQKLTVDVPTSMSEGTERRSWFSIPIAPIDPSPGPNAHRNHQHLSEKEQDIPQQASGAAGFHLSIDNKRDTSQVQKSDDTVSKIRFDELKKECD